MRSVCVFCGSNTGIRPEYLACARAAGALLARRNVTVIYGGGRVGLMGALADAAIAQGGRVIGVIPQLLLDREVGHSGLSELHVVSTLSERKRLMNELADGYLVLPGGAGTLDELFEVWTWNQLELQRKPCALLNLHGYYDSLLAFIEHAVAEGFIRPRHRAALLTDTSIEPLLDSLAQALATAAGASS